LIVSRSLEFAAMQKEISSLKFFCVASSAMTAMLRSRFMFEDAADMRFASNAGYTMSGRFADAPLFAHTIKVKPNA